MAMRKGMALLLVVLLAFAAFAAVTGLIGSLTTRNRTVSGSAVADRALAVADGAIDQTLTAINRLGFAFGSLTANRSTATAATTAVVNQALADVNGGSSSGTRVVYVSAVGDDMYTIGTESNAGKLVKWPIDTGGEVVVADSMAAMDPQYASDNKWFQVNVQTNYREDVDAPDTWAIKATAFNISVPSLKRTVFAQARQGDIATQAVQGDTTANGTWYTYQTTTTTTPHFFCDYSGMYGDDVYFGKYEVTEGPIFASGNLHMGGWAKDPIYATGSIGDDALDGSSHDGRFGPADSKGDANKLAWAKKNGYANGGQTAPQWPNGDKALYGSSTSKKSTDTGMQDVCLPAYYISGGSNNTIVFSVENGVGKVTINGTKLDMPSNGVIYVDGGNATVSGTVKGRVTVGAGPSSGWGSYGNIYIGGNIVYNTPPRNNPNDPMPAVPDALGLVAYDDIVIPSSTYDANRTLQVDAALMCVHGSFHIDNSASWHYVSSNPSQQYTAWWNGAQACYSTDEVPCITQNSWYGTQAKGYEAQHTRFDYNLLNYGAPPMFPSTSNNSTTTDHRFVPVPESAAILTQLRQLTKTGVVPLNPAKVDDHGQQMFYKVTIGGVDYYYGNQFGVITTGYSAAYTPNQLYRISWREVIDDAVPSPSTASAG